MEWPKRARTVNWESGVLTLDGEKQFEVPELTMELMERLAGYTLVGFHVKGYPVTDELLAPFAGHKSMANFGVEDGALTDACFPVFSAMPKLRYLLLDGNAAIHGSGLSALQGCKLDLLTLNRTGLDDAGLEEAVLLTLKKQLEILLPVHKDGTIHLEATAAKCSEYEKQMEVLKDQKQALFERYLLGQIELDTYKSEKAVYDTEILKVKNAYAAVTAQAKLKREEQARQSSRQEIAHSIEEADALTSELTDLLIEKVYVFPDNRIEIVYKVHDLFE